MTTIDPRFPHEIHALWGTLDTEITWLHGRWIIYRQLYGTSPDRVELLNKSAGTFFNMLQDVLLHDVQLSLSKIGDPAGSGSRENVTLFALPESVKKSSKKADFPIEISHLVPICGSPKR
ncbi:MAG: hypothetical protein Q7J33_07875 [Serpentinimonas sp.]|nr:hypothetical protein [Serpentinimonas sp.]